MVEISAFDAHASVSALLRSNRVTAPNTPTSTSTSATAPSDKTTPLEGASFRAASRTEAAVFGADLTGVERTTKGVGEALSGSFEELLEIFHGTGKAAAALETALASVSDLIASAAADADVEGVQIRVTSVVRSFGAENGEDAAFGSVTGFAIEVGLVRGDRIAAEDTRLVGLAGEPLPLSGEQRRTGVVDGVYRIRDEGRLGDDLATFRGENKAQLEALQNALDRLSLVQDALKSYRNGDTRALEEVEKFFRAGTLDAGAVRAISDVRGTNQTVVPGAGVIRL